MGKLKRICNEFGFCSCGFARFCCGYFADMVDASWALVLWQSVVANVGNALGVGIFGE